MRIKPQLYVHFEDGRYEQQTIAGRELRYEDAADKFREILGGDFKVFCWDYRNCTYYVMLDPDTQKFKDAIENRSLTGTLRNPIRGKVVFFYGFNEHEYANPPGDF